MNSQLREKAVNLRIREELSYSEIRKKLGVPKSTLSYWLREFPLNENKIIKLYRYGWKKGEAGREKFRLTMEKKQKYESEQIYRKQQEKFAVITDDMFFVAGLMLYAAEGDKKNYSRLVIANTDPDIIKFFVIWSRQFLNVREDEIKIQLHLYEGMDVEKERVFWQEKLKMNNPRFYKPMIRKLRKNSFSYSESYRHGTCSMYILGVQRKREVMMGIKAFMEKINQKI